MERKTVGSDTERARPNGRRMSIAKISAVALVVALPLLRRRLMKMMHEHCRKMIHEMEFGERPSCEMCFEMHSAMHRRLEREMEAPGHRETVSA